MFRNLRKSIAGSASRALSTKKLAIEHQRQKEGAEMMIAKVLKHRPENRIDEAMRKRAHDYAGDVFGTPVHAPWLEAYATHKGEFLEGWLPQSFYHAELLDYWPDIRRVRARTLQGRVLQTDAFPDVAIQYNGHWLTKEGDPVAREEVSELIFADCEEVVVKTDRSLQGLGTTRHHKSDFDINALPATDLVIQRYTLGHPDIAKLMPDNAPTIRVLTVKPKGGIAKARSSLIKIGRRGDAIMTAAASLWTMIAPDGRLAAQGYDNDWKPLSETPDTGVVFADVTIPSFAKAARLCERLHDGCPTSPIVGWDLTIDDNEEPVIFEWNIGNVGMNYHESEVGPLFADLPWTAKGIAEGLA